METIYEKYIGVIFDGRYKIEKVIGLGGMAVVFKAVDIKTERYVAVKLLREDMAQEEESVKRFINESKAVSMLSHPNIVKIFAVSVRDNLKYIVMEYVEGITLKTYMEKKGKLSLRETLSITRQILNALIHAHEKGIVHRDIKPQNIMLLRNGQIKVTDFGIAKLPNAETLTMTDKAIGTVFYISPEQASGQSIDNRSDLYSLGVTMYEMVTGELPFTADRPVSVALMQVNSQPIPPKEIDGEIPEGLNRIILNAMEKDPEERYQNAISMMEDVEKLIKDPAAVIINENKKKEETNFKAIIKKLFSGSMLPVALGVFVPFLIICIIAGVILFNGLVNKETKSETIKVPQFTESYYNDELADYFSKNSDIYKVELKYKYDTEYEDGYIIEQSPKAGSQKKVEPGVKFCEIVLTVAKTGEGDTVPDITADNRQNAELKLKSLGIKYTLEEINDDVYAAGQVIKTEPAAGENLPSGETLTVYISIGPDSGDKEVPKLTDITEAAALAKLLDAGLRLGEVSYVKSEKKAGTVVSQSISEKTKVSQNTKIDISVSGGKDYDPEKGLNPETTADTTKKAETTKKSDTTKAPTVTKAPETSKVPDEPNNPVTDNSGESDIGSDESSGIAAEAELQI